MSIPDNIEISETIEANAGETSIRIRVTFPAGTSPTRAIKLLEILNEEMEWFFLAEDQL